MKILFDSFFSLILLILLIPVFVATSLLILAFDGIPVFFIQERAGLNRKKFSLIKFRTMKDNSITPVGRWLRVAGLDEIPQLINILKGEMSFIGPRPLIDDDIIRLGWDSPDHDVRWRIRPGLTGPAQLSKVCDPDVTWGQDMEYIEKNTVLLDIKIICLTLTTVIAGKKPVKNAAVRCD